MADPISELFRRSEMLEVALKESGKRGKAAAEAEREYRIALASKILELRDKGFPATLIPDVARGDKTVAGLKFDRDVSQVVYDNAKEAINAYKKQIDILREQIDREWKNA